MAVKVKTNITGQRGRAVITVFITSQVRSPNMLVVDEDGHLIRVADRDLYAQGHYMAGKVKRSLVDRASIAVSFDRAQSTASALRREVRTLVQEVNLDARSWNKTRSKRGKTVKKSGNVASDKG